MKKFVAAIAMPSAAVLGASAFIGGTGLMISSGWLITMASAHPPVLTLTVAIVMVRFFGISRSVARYFERVISHEAVFASLTKLRVNLFEKITQQPISLARDLNSGAMVKGLVDDVERAQEYKLRITLPYASALIALSAGVLLGWWINVRSLIITIPAAAILLGVIPFISRTLCESNARTIEVKESLYSSQISELTFGYAEARVYGYEDELLMQTHKIEQEILTEEKRLNARVKNLQLAATMTVAAVLYFLANLAYHLKIDKNAPDVSVTMLIFLPLVIFEAITLWYPNLFTAGKMLRAQASINSILHSPDVESKPATNTFISSSPRLTLQSARVSWGSEFMSPVTFDLEPGEKIRIKGRSGSGKSTLAMGLVGALNYSGSMTLDGVELTEIDGLEHYIVADLQRSHIFNTSIRENMRIANQNATDAEIYMVLKLVELDSLVAENAEGLNTVIGEFGRHISGGEAKRLSLARILLSKAPILILDEPTEHLELELALRIEKRILDFTSSKTVVVITHSGWHEIGRTLELSR
ncbi:MAG: thiol reductant ABC exporter subunit CydC [Actinobacteria bacterium]|jgi:thiol reductant ABC exporter CydC subunit|nr:thiol reductant ABC exporter subunit CydC [Actinomycetota bacterium]